MAKNINTEREEILLEEGRINNWTVKDVGKIHFELKKDLGNNTKDVEKFLRQLIEGIAKHSTEYHSNTNGRDHIFIYSEKQLNSVVCPIIARDISPIFKMEFPIKRSGKSRRGNLDYWVYTDNNVIALELKLAHISYSSKNFAEKKSIFNKYNKALKQIKGIEEDKNLWFMETNGVIKIALEAIVFQKNSKKEISIDEKKLEEIQQNIEERFNNLVEVGKHKISKGLKFDEEINFKSLWLPDKNLISIKGKRRGKNRVCAALGFIGYVSDYILPNM